MKSFVTGALGQLGQDLRLLLEAGAVYTDRLGNDELGTVALDITDETAVMNLISETKPDVIYHCAAYTNVDGAEDDLEAAKAVNEVGTANVAKAAAAMNAKLVVISTDYVFDGTKKMPYTETDTPNPQSVYGETKLSGELAATNANERTFVVRTAWLYGPEKLIAPVKNFPQTMQRLAKDRSELTIVNDQVGSPTYTHDLAQAIVKLAETDQFGIWNITNSGQASWYEFACEILKDVEITIEPIPSKAYPQKAKRPNFSVLDTSKFATEFGALRSWKEALAEYSAQGER